RPSGREEPEILIRRAAFSRLEFGNNLGTITPKHRGKRGSRADQKAGRINKIDVPALSAKPPFPVQIRAARFKLRIDELQRDRNRGAGSFGSVVLGVPALHAGSTDVRARS